MTIQIKVPSIVCEGCAETITKAIKGNEPEASVTVDLSNKIVTVDGQSTLESLKQMIVAVGHSPE